MFRDDRPYLLRSPRSKPARTVPLGHVVMTQGVAADVPPDEILTALRRHARADWGEVPLADQRANDRALESGERLLSAYRTRAGVKFWIITEADRSSTCVLLPGEY